MTKTTIDGNSISTAEKQEIQRIEDVILSSNVNADGLVRPAGNEPGIV